MRSAPSPLASGAQVVVLTRAAEDNAALAEVARRAGAHVVQLPCIATQALPDGPAHAEALRRLSHTAAVAFASRQGVAAFAALLTKHGTPLPRSTACYAVGPATAAAVHRALKRTATLPARFDAAGLAEAMAEALGAAQVRVLLPAAREGRPTLAQVLAARGHDVVRLAMYATVPAPARRPPMTWDARVHYIVCASPSAVGGFFAQAEVPGRARFVCIGPTTSAAVRARGQAVFAEAPVHDARGLSAVLTLALESP